MHQYCLRILRLCYTHTRSCVRTSIVNETQHQLSPLWATLQYLYIQFYNQTVQVRDIKSDWVVRKKSYAWRGRGEQYTQLCKSTHQNYMYMPNGFWIMIYATFVAGQPPERMHVIVLHLLFIYSTRCMPKFILSFLLCEINAKNIVHCRYLYSLH